MLEIAHEPAEEDWVSEMDRDRALEWNWVPTWLYHPYRLL
jgi:hypothetical protein